MTVRSRPEPGEKGAPEAPPPEDFAVSADAEQPAFDPEAEPVQPRVASGVPAVAYDIEARVLVRDLPELVRRGLETLLREIRRPWRDVITVETRDGGARLRVLVQRSVLPTAKSADRDPGTFYGVLPPKGERFPPRKERRDKLADTLEAGEVVTE